MLIPQLRITPDFERAALYGITPAAITEALEGLSNGRVVSQIVEGNRRFDVVVRLAEDERSTGEPREPFGADAEGLRAAAPHRNGRGGRRPEPDPARERPAPHCGLRQCRRAPRHGGDHRRCQARPGRDEPAARLRHQSGGHVPGPGGGDARHRRAVAGLARADLHGPLHALPVGGAHRHRADQHPAGAHRQRRGTLDRRPVIVRRFHDRLHHARGISARNGILKVSHYINLALYEDERFGRELVIRGSLERLSRCS